MKLWIKTSSALLGILLAAPAPAQQMIERFSTNPAGLGWFRSRQAACDALAAVWNDYNGNWAEAPNHQFTVSHSVGANEVCLIQFIVDTDPNQTVREAGYGIIKDTACTQGHVWQPSANNGQGACLPVIVQDGAGKPPPQCDGQGNPIFPSVGAKIETLDLGVQLAGMPMTLTYSSTYGAWGVRGDPELSGDVAAYGALGRAWFSNYHRSLLFGGANQSIRALRGNAAAYSFLVAPSGAWLPDADVADTLQATANGFRYVDTRKLRQEVYSAQGRLLQATDHQGRSITYTYSDGSTPASVAPAAGYLITATDLFGRRLEFAYRTLPGGTVVLRMVRDVLGQPITFDYDSDANLTSVTWQDGAVRRFQYEVPFAQRWALTGITDENLTRYATFGYDRNGRAISTELAGGVGRYAASYSSAPQVQVEETFDPTAQVVRRARKWTQPAGTVVTHPTGERFAQGMTVVFGLPRMTSRSQPAGSGCAASTSTQSYDLRGNVTSRNDFNGQRACYAYDVERNLETVRVEGLESAADCSGVTPAGTLLPSGTRKTSTAWHPDWPLPKGRVRPKQTTAYVYNGQPDPSAVGTTASCAPANALLPDGKPLAVLCKQIDLATSDADGAWGFGEAQGEADTAPGEPDPLFNQVSLLLHMDGIAGGMEYPDASTRAHVPSTVASSLVTDPSNAKFGSAGANFIGGHLLYPASSDWDMGAGDFTVEFWAKFNSASIGSRVFMLGQGAANGGNQTFYVGKNTDNRLTMGLTTSGTSGNGVGSSAVAANTWYHIALVRSGNALTLYRNGSVEATASVSGTVPARSTQFSIGALGEYISSYGGAFGTKMMGWMDEVRITKGVARYSGTFNLPTKPFVDLSGYVPPSKTATAPTILSTQIRSWTYNESGQVLTARDPLNNLTTYAYYSDTTDEHTTGDLQSVTNASGQITQYTRYDRSGRVLQSIDANGAVTDTTYTPRGWVKTVTVTPPGAAAQLTVYDYDGVGQLKKVTLPDGTALEYTYDAAHRLTGVKDNAGNSVTYTLDNMGNRRSEDLKDPGGTLARNITRVYDALNRVESTLGTAQ